MDEKLEQELVKKTAAILRLAKQVIGALKDENEMPFFEEPSLTDLVLIAQIIGQTAAVDKLDVVGQGLNPRDPVPEPFPAYRTPAPAPPEEMVAIGDFMFDLTMSWAGDGWLIDTCVSNPAIKVTTMEDMGRAISKAVVAIWAKRKGR